MGRKQIMNSAAVVASTGLALTAGVPAVAAASTNERVTPGPSVASTPGAASTPAAINPGGVPLSAGFNPLTASDASLQAHGLPPRPPGKTPKWWIDFVTTPGMRTFAEGTPTDRHTVPPPEPAVSRQQSESGSPPPQPSPNWAGYVVHYGEGAGVDYTESSWVMPWSSSFALDSGNSAISSWAGIGDGDDDVLIQAGSSTYLPSDGGPENHCWWEAFPDNYQHNLDMECYPGDTIKVAMTIAVGDGGDATAYYNVYNVSRHQSRVAEHAITGSWGNQVEFISERPSYETGERPAREIDPSDLSLYDYPNFFLLSDDYSKGYTFHDNQWAVAGISGVKNLSDGYSYKNYMHGCVGSPNFNSCDDPYDSFIGYSSNKPSSTGAFSTFRGPSPSLEDENSG